MDIVNLIEEKRIKRLFRARGKFSYPDACCHITQRAPGREQLFLEEADYLLMLHLLKEKKKKFNFEIYSFCLMPNHLHLQIKLTKDNMIESMKNLFESYARIFNKKYERKGHVFCGPYRQALCLDDGYAIAASIYIHLNPVRAGLVKQAIDYRWTSSRLYLEPVNKESFVNYEFILKILNEDINQARNIYKELLARAEKIEMGNVCEAPNAMNIFKDKLFQRLQCHPVESLQKTFSSKNDLLGEITMEEKIKELYEKGRLRKPEELRARKYLIEQLKARGFSIAHIAEKLNVSRQSIYDTLNLTK